MICIWAWWPIAVKEQPKMQEYETLNSRASQWPSMLAILSLFFLQAHALQLIWSFSSNSHRKQEKKERDIVSDHVASICKLIISAVFCSKTVRQETVKQWKRRAPFSMQLSSGWFVASTWVLSDLLQAQPFQLICVFGNCLYHLCYPRPSNLRPTGYWTHPASDQVNNDNRGIRKYIGSLKEIYWKLRRNILNEY